MTFPVTKMLITGVLVVSKCGGLASSPASTSRCLDAFVACNGCDSATLQDHWRTECVAPAANLLRT